MPLRGLHVLSEEECDTGKDPPQYWQALRMSSIP